MSPHIVILQSKPRFTRLPRPEYNTMKRQIANIQRCDSYLPLKGTADDIETDRVKQ